jgi:hypothetical protein
MIEHFIEFVNDTLSQKRLHIFAFLVVFTALILGFTTLYQTPPPSSETSRESVPDITERVSKQPVSIPSTSFEQIIPPITDSPDVVMPADASVESPATKETPAPVTPVFTSSILHTIEVGVFAGTLPELYTFEHRIGAQADIVATAVHWGNERAFPEAYANLVTGRGDTFFIFWYPMDYTKNAEGQSSFHFSEITNGAWDAYIEEFAAAAARTDGTIIIAPFEEVNGNWVYWNGVEGTYGTQKEYKEAFQYLREKFRGVPNVSFAWVINQVSVPNTSENAISTYYPGDAYVDLIGINAFNFGTPWLSFDTLVTSAIAQTLPYRKPIYITSTASTEDARKARWIQEMFASSYFKNDLLKGFVWFNETKERDWAVWSDTEAETAFRNSFLETR